MAVLDLERLPAALEKMSTAALYAFLRINEAGKEAERIGDEGILIKAIHEAGTENINELLCNLPIL